MSGGGTGRNSGNRRSNGSGSGSGYRSCNGCCCERAERRVCSGLIDDGTVLVATRAVMLSEGALPARTGWPGNGLENAGRDMLGRFGLSWSCW